MDKLRPRVTAILRAVGLAPEFPGVSPAMLELGAERGRAIHKAIELSITGELDPESVDGSILPAVDAFGDFLKTTGLEVVLSEYEVVSELYQYAGRLDLVLRRPAASFCPGGLVLVDLKTGAVHASAWVQLAAYRLALAETLPEFEVGELGILHLSSAGGFRYYRQRFEMMELERVWRAARLVYDWKGRKI